MDNVVQIERNMTTQITKFERIGWIDLLKGMAILAVVVDHTHTILYTNPNIRLLSLYSVTLFVFLAGITAYLSMELKNVIVYDKSYVWKRIKNILIPYAVATFISLCVTNRFFDLGVYLRALVGFNTWGPYYFIVFFLQLILISPVLFLIIKLIQKNKHKLLLYFISVVVITFLSYIFTMFTFVVDVLAARVILGGSYFLVFFLGLLFASFNLKFITMKQMATYSVIFIGLLTFFIVMYARQGPIILGLTNTLIFWQFNPPGVLIIVYATLVFGAFGSFYCLCEKTLPKNLMKIFNPVEVCGKYSMTIFFYHSLFLSLGTQLANLIPQLRNSIWFYRIFILFAMIVLPILGQILFSKIKSAYGKTLKEIAI